MKSKKSKSRSEKDPVNLSWNREIAVERAKTLKVSNWYTVHPDMRKCAIGVGDQEVSENLVIKADNLHAMQTMIPRFAGKVKMIYIDPPYNTGSDSFCYNDSFGHSSWLTFMKNRLEVARRMLRPDGAIFVRIDDNERAYLKVLMDEIFWRNNFIWTIVYKRSSPKNNAKHIASVHEYVLVYSRSEKENLSFNGRITEKRSNLVDMESWRRYSLMKLDTKCNAYNKGADYQLLSPDGTAIYPGGSLSGRKNRMDGKHSTNDWCWRWSKETTDASIAKNGIEFKKSKAWIRQAYAKKYDDEANESPYASVLDNGDGAYNSEANKHMEGMFEKGIFSYPKPERLIATFIHMATKPGDLVLDFFAGSGTTAATCLKMGRRFITIERMDYCETVTCKRLEKVIAGERGGISTNERWMGKGKKWEGGGSFTYLELADQWTPFYEIVREKDDFSE